MYQGKALLLTPVFTDTASSTGYHPDRVTEHWTQPTPSPQDAGLAEDQNAGITLRSFPRYFGCGHLSMFRRNCQTFRPIVRPLLSALTELDLDAAATPDYPNLSTWIRSDGLLSTQRYLHPRLPRRQFLRLSR